MSIPNARLRQHRQLLRENADCTVGSGSLISTAFRGGATVHYRQNFGPIARRSPDPTVQLEVVEQHCVDDPSPMR